MTYRPKDTEERIDHRLKISKGHLEKVIKMVDNHEYCIDIIHQIIAIQEALKATSDLILENHLNTCVADAIRKGKTKSAIDEIMEIMKKKQV